ncbi:Organic anion transporting polypeptide [Operophtera brumata]|uniref:Organic anion transporting polypeptide n=1 Tax=Operophtera brumata TaxID=104452 RepID=A0A0L7LTU7_OPEBR|nr:Organic anion transporting polypeptide [Operophtera brumata]
MTEGEKQQNAGGTNSAPQHRKGHRRQESMYAMTGLYAESGGAEGEEVAGPSTPPHPTHPPRESIKEKPPQLFPEILDIPHDTRDCGILSWRPLFIQQFSSIKVFVFFLSILVTLQQALSSGYINSVITTIEKRFDIPSSLSGLIASSYEIGNVITVIFVSYLGSRRHIPVWIAVGAVIMGIGSLVFVVPHFIAEVNSETLANNKSDDNICRLPRSLEADMGGLGRLSPSTFVPVMVFVVAQLLLGCGGSPLLTLGTTYVDDHVRPESSSISWRSSLGRHVVGRLPPLRIPAHPGRDLLLLIPQSAGPGEGEDQAGGESRGSIAIPGACIGIFMGGCLLKRLELRPKGAVQFVLISNTICLSCYALLFFLGCDNIKMAGTTIPYTNNSRDMAAVVSGASASALTAAGGAREYSEVTVVPVATAGACNPPCTTIFPFLVLLFFMTFIVAIVALGIFMADWWLVRRRRHLETAAPLDHKDIAGSIISLDKLFEELPSTENASGFRTGATSGLSSASTTPVGEGGAGEGGAGGLQRTESQHSHDSHAPVATSRVLTASRHLRNDSKTIQLEPRARQHSLEEHAHGHSRSASRELSLDQLKQLALRSMDSLDLTVLPLARCADDESKRLLEGGGALRHRRTGSRDMKPPDTNKHKRTSSHHLTMEPHDLSLQMQKGRSVDQLATAPLDPRISA